jgi:hypothetical protein
MPKKIKKENFHEEINALFEKLMEQRDRSLSGIEGLKKNLVWKLDQEIKLLYAKKDLIANIWVNRGKLRLERVSVLKKFLRNSFWINVRYFASMPFIYGMIIPGIFLHITIEIYHQICFRIYNIPRVKANEYFIFDRQLLPYLNWFEKLNCLYCSYFNCLMAYSREIAGRTERYWCPIKHSRVLKDPHEQYDKFIEYSEGEIFRKEWERLRKFE